MKTVVLTGASSGFGFQAKTLLEAQGFRVVGASRSSAPALDLRNPQSITTFANWVQQSFPDGIDALVNNAGVGVYGPSTAVPLDKLRDQFEVNFFGMVELTKLLLPLLSKKKGVLVQVGSVLGTYGLGYTSAYVASKFAVTGWSESVRTEFNRVGVRVVLIEPGSFGTGFSNAVQWFGEDAEEVRNYRAYHDHKKRNGDLQEVPHAILKAISSPRGFARLRCGREPKILHWARRILPEVIYYKILDQVESRIFR